MRIRILAPETTIGGKHYVGGDELTVAGEDVRVANRLIRSGYAINIEREEKRTVAELRETLEKAGIPVAPGTKKSELEAAVADLPNTEEV